MQVDISPAPGQISQYRKDKRWTSQHRYAMEKIVTKTLKHFSRVDPLHPFSLQHFSDATNILPPMSISGQAARDANLLAIDFFLTGDLAQLVIAPPAAEPSRRDNLWQTTCFECFFAPPESLAYWECNLSPAGHWNIYRFTDYRQGKQPEATITNPPLTVSRNGKQSLHLSLRLALGKIVLPALPISLGISAVVESCAGTLSYWALRHSGVKPDFHRREDFLLIL